MRKGRGRATVGVSAVSCLQCTVKAKFHYASWFEAGRRQVQSQIPLRYLVRTSFEQL